MKMLELVKNRNHESSGELEKCLVPALLPCLAML
jgi:hypothetical protein